MSGLLQKKLISFRLTGQLLEKLDAVAKDQGKMRYRSVKGVSKLMPDRTATLEMLVREAHAQIKRAE